MHTGKKIIKRTFAFLIVFILFLASIPFTYSYAASPLKIYDYSKKAYVTYNGKRVSYTYNSVKIPVDDIPGIINDDGVALGPYAEIFGAKGLGFSISKDSTGKIITFKNNGNTMVLTVGSKTAEFNGREITLQAAPVSIRYVSAKKSRILVPTRSIAEAFGYNYVWDSVYSTVSIAKSMRIQYNGTSYPYSGTIASVTFDGNEVPVAALPTIILSQTAMLRAYAVFKTAMGISYRYDSKTGKITFVKGDVTLEMYKNSTVCYINGVKTDCGIAPRFIKNMNNGIKALVVPGRFVAESLGYSYTWDQTAKMSVIKTTDYTGDSAKIASKNNDQNSESDDGDKTYYSWIVDENKYLQYEDVLNNTVTEINSTSLPSSESTAAITGITRNTTAELTNNSNVTDELYFECYEIDFDSKVEHVDTELTENTLAVTFYNTSCTSKKYGSFEANLISNVASAYSSANNTSDVTFTTSADYPYYNIALSDDGMMCTVTLYPNYLTGLEFGHDGHGDYICFKGLTAFDSTYTEDTVNSQIIMKLSNTANTLGNIVFPSDLFEEYFISAVLYESDPNCMELIINGPKTSSAYKTVTDANLLYLYFDYNDIVDTNGSQTSLDGSEISIKLPDGVQFKDILTSDLYLDKEILIKIPGNYTAFYSTDRILNTYDTVESIDTSFSDGYTQIKFITSKLQAFRLSDNNDGTMSLKIADPKKIYDKIIVLDAGHGGNDPGASAGGYDEKDINFLILNTYVKQYFEDSNVKVYFTRLDDTLIDLYERAYFPTTVQADMFISLHMNAVSDTSVNGTAVYYSLLNVSKNSGGLTGKLLASALETKLVSALGTKNNGIKTANFVVIRETAVPAVLIELGFITNASDRKIITTKSTQMKAAKTIYDTVMSLYDSYPVD